jgi:LacI family transcriptional regulator
MKARPRVALLIESSSAYARGLLRGIYSYIREHGPWLIYLLEAEQGDSGPGLIHRKWRGDGIMAHVANPQMCHAIMATGLPVIDLGGLEHLSPSPKADSDDILIAELGVNHLLDRGFKEFGFYSDDRFSWATRRKEAFAARVLKAGHPCDVYVRAGTTRGRQNNWEQEDKRLAAWVRQLPKPTGVMACHDYHAWRLLEVCHRLNVSVPDEVAVIGVDNDELLCDLAAPPLTSVKLNTQRIGYEASKMLDAWMSGKRPDRSVHIPPIQVVTRQSTDVLAISDSEISQAVRFIRDHACEGIKVNDVLRVVPLSRCVLEYRFKKLLGHTPHEEILRVQFQNVTRLLLETELSMPAIADRTGFRHAAYMTVAFKQRFQTTPSEYRAGRT